MIYKFLIFLAINSVIAALAAMAPASLTNGDDYVSVSIVHDFVESVASDTKLNIILGDSRSQCCLDAKELGFINLSYQGASPVEGYYLLNRLLERGVQVDRLVMSYGPFHIFTQDTFHAQTRYFGLTDSGYVDSIVEQAKELNDTEYLEYNWRALVVIDDSVPWLPDWLKIRLLNVLSIDRTIESVWSQLWRRLTRPEADAIRRAELERTLIMAAPPDRMNTGSESPEFQKQDAASPINEIYLKKLVELASQHQVQIHYLIMPFNHDVLHPDKTYYDRYYTILDEAGLQGCYDPANWWPNEFFSDTHHLNVAGTLKYGSELSKHHLSYCH